MYTGDKMEGTTEKRPITMIYIYYTVAAVTLTIYGGQV
jgi:hypothetical protein